MKKIFNIRELSLVLLLTVFSFFNIYIYMLQNSLIATKSDYYILLINIMVLTAVLYLTIKSYQTNFAGGGKSECGRSKEYPSGGKYLGIIWILQIACWFPVFLAYYPGLFNYDIASQIPQAIGSYNTHHPLVHTLYLQFFYYIVGGRLFDNYTVGIATATIVQMVLFSVMLAYVHLFLMRMSISKWIRYTLIAMVCFSPVFSLLGISMTKDIFFAGNVAILFTSLGYWYRLPEYCNRLYKILYILSVAGTILFRNNGIYPVILLCIALIVHSIKQKSDYRIIGYTLVGIIIGLLISMSLQHGLKASKGSFNETLSLPYQQMACAYIDNQNDLSNEEKELVKLIIPSVENYRVDISDTIKGNAQAVEHVPEFLKIYFKLLVQYPGSYVKAFSNLNAGYLCITDTTFAEIYGTTNRQGIFLTDTKEGFDINHRSYLPGLEAMYEALYTANKYENVLGLNLLCSPAVYFWILISIITYAVVTNQKDLTPMLVFIITFLITVLAGPCSLIRYALPYIICVPIIGACSLQENKNCK